MDGEVQVPMFTAMLFKVGQDLQLKHDGFVEGTEATRDSRILPSSSYAPPT